MTAEELAALTDESEVVIVSKSDVGELQLEPLNAPEDEIKKTDGTNDMRGEKVVDGEKVVVPLVVIETLTDRFICKFLGDDSGHTFSLPANRVRKDR